MVVNNNLKTVSKAQKHSQWSFISPTLSGTFGVVIGLVIGNFLGWV